MVITRHGNHAAKLSRPRHVGVFEDVGAAVHARSFAVPDAKHAIKLVGTLWRKPKLLRAPQCGGRQLFVDAGLENNVLRLQIRGCFPQCLVIATQGRATVAADKTSRVFTLQLVAQALQHGQLDQGLHTTHEGGAVVKRIFIVQRDGF